MAIATLADNFVSLCISTSLNYYDGKARFIVEGQYTPIAGLAVPIVPDIAIKLNSVQDIDAMFAKGSVLAEGLRYAYTMCPSNVQIFALPRLDAASSVAAIYDLTITGPATSIGTIDLYMVEANYSISVPVAVGDTVAIMAANAAAMISAYFPYTVTATATGLHFVAKNAGTIGNGFNVSVNWRGLRNQMPLGVTVGPLVATTPGSIDPVAPNYAAALGECCYTAYALLSSNLTWQRGMRDWIRSSWDCTKPQCFGHGYAYRSGTSGAIIATFDNSAELSILAVNAADLVPGWIRAVSYAALSACNAIAHPELNIQGTTSGLLTTIRQPSNCLRNWTVPEYKLLAAQGFVLDGPASQGGGYYTNPYIYNDVTEWLYDDLGRPNATFLNVSSRRLSAAIASSLAVQLASFNGLSAYVGQTKIGRGIFGTNKNLMYGSIVNWAKTQVGILFGDFSNITTDIVLTSDFDTSPACQGIPGKFALMFKYRQPARINNISVIMLPAALDNCNR